MKGFVLIAIIGLGLTLILYGGKIINPDNTGKVSAATCDTSISETGARLIKTVAHVEVDNPDLELIYKDDNADIAYYSYVGDTAFVEKGDNLQTIHGDTVTVLTTDITGFTIDAKGAISAGQSGESILDSDGNCVGYISTELSNGNIFCIWN